MMSHRFFLAAAILLMLPTFAGAESPGRLKVGTCLGCHGVPHYTNVYPSYHVPKLAGQHAEYIAAALRAYKTGERSHSTMRAQAAQLSEADIAEMAEFFAAQPAATGDQAAVQAPAELEDKLAVCVACHGATGNSPPPVEDSPLPVNPRLAGQHRDYLYRALADYKSGARKNAIMAGMAGILSEQDMKALAAFYAANPGLGSIDVGHSAFK